MKKIITVLLLSLFTIATLSLAGCGRWGYRGGYGHGYYRGCGYPGY